MAADQEELGFPPPHPGSYLREDILPALGMSITELADHLKVARPTLSALVHEKKSVSMEMAQSLGRAFGNGARFWLALRFSTTSGTPNTRPKSTLRRSNGGTGKLPSGRFL